MRLSCCVAGQVVRPNKYGKAFMEAWSGRAKEDAEAGVDDQERVMQVSQAGPEHE